MAGKSGNQDTLSDLDPRLFGPWSSRASFAASVCDLVTLSSGCWRARWEERNPSDRTGTGIPHANEGAFKSAPAWLIFERHAGTGEGRLRYQTRAVGKDVGSEATIPIPEGKHQVVFALDRTSPLTRDAIVSVRAKAWVGGRHENIETWWNSAEGGSTGVVDLFHAFGPGTFVVHPSDELPLRDADLPDPDLLSVHACFEALLDNLCKVYRGKWKWLDPSYGLYRCHADVHIKRTFAEAGCFFSYVDTYDEEVRPIPGLWVGEFQDPWERVGGLSHQQVRGLKVRNPFSSRTYGEATTFADCFVGLARRKILPSELDQGYLAFPIGEIITALMFWMTLRILSTPGVPTAFLEGIETLRHAKTLAEGARSVEHLRSVEVTLAPDTVVFENPLPTGTHPFESILRDTGVCVRHVTQLASAARFLVVEWSETRYRESMGFRWIPNYSDLGWKLPEWMRSWEPDSVEDLLARGSDSSASNELLACVLSTVLAGLPSAAGSEEGVHSARTVLDLFRSRSVIPLGMLATLMPRDSSIAHHYILPLWEERYQDNLRPVIFAHVFSRRHKWTAGLAELTQEVRSLHSLLLQQGSFLAHHLWAEADRKRADQEKLRALEEGAYGVGHTLKNRLEQPLQPLEDTARRIKEIDTVLGSLPANVGTSEGGDSLTRELIRLRSLVRHAGDSTSSVQKELRRLQGLGELWTLHQELTERRGEAVFLSRADQRWVVWEAELSIGDLVLEEVEALGERVESFVELGPGLRRLVVSNWLQGKTKPGRPFTDFYRHLLFELLLNAKEHILPGRAERAPVLVTLISELPEIWRHSWLERTPAVCIRNRVDETRARGDVLDVVRQPAGVWVLPDELGSSRTLARLGRMLRLSTAGELAIRALEDSDKWYFEVLIGLRGTRAAAAGQPT